MRITVGGPLMERIIREKNKSLSKEFLITSS